MILGKKTEVESKSTNRYFYVDYGQELTEEMKLMLEIVVGALKITKDFHLVEYVTDQPNSFFLQEITEDEFLEHYKKND